MLGAVARRERLVHSGLIRCRCLMSEMSIGRPTACLSAIRSSVATTRMGAATLNSTGGNSSTSTLTPTSSSARSAKASRWRSTCYCLSNSGSVSAFSGTGRTGASLSFLAFAVRGARLSTSIVALHAIQRYGNAADSGANPHRIRAPEKYCTARPKPLYSCHALLTPHLAIALHVQPAGRAAAATKLALRYRPKAMWN